MGSKCAVGISSIFDTIFRFFYIFDFSYGIPLFHGYIPAILSWSKYTVVGEKYFPIVTEMFISFHLVVHRLNVELSRYQAKYRPVSFEVSYFQELS